MADFQFVDRQKAGPSFVIAPAAQVFEIRNPAGTLSLPFPVHPSEVKRLTIIEGLSQPNGTLIADLLEGQFLSSAVQVGKSQHILFRPNEIVIGFRPVGAETRARFAQQYGLSLVRFDYRGQFGVYRTLAGESFRLFETLSGDDRVEFAELNVLDGIEDEVFELNDAESGISLNDVSTPLWSHSVIESGEGGRIDDGKHVTIAVVDGLFDHRHPAIVDALVDPKLDIRFAEGLVARPHGLAVASVAVGRSKLSNGKPLGIAPAASLLPIAIDTVGTKSYPARATAINFLAEVAARKELTLSNQSRQEIKRLVVNCSWQLRASVDLASVRRSFQSLERSGAVCVCSAGNDHTGDEHFPSDYGRNISVASIGKNEERSTFSNWGNRVDLSAPGGTGDPSDEDDMLLACEPNTYTYFWGTSFASPCVAGTIAALWSRNLDATSDEIIEFAKKGLARPYSKQPDHPLGEGIVSLKQISKFKSPQGGA